VERSVSVVVPATRTLRSTRYLSMSTQLQTLAKQCDIPPGYDVALSVRCSQPYVLTMIQDDEMSNRVEHNWRTFRLRFHELSSNGSDNLDKLVDIRDPWPLLVVI